MITHAHSTKIYLIRHATPDWGRKDIPYDIPPGPPLIPQGETEAALLGSFIQQAGIQKLYHSPLERAKRTAQISAAVAGIDIEEDVAIAEFRSDENRQQLAARILPAWERFLKESETLGPIGLVTHGGPVRLLLEHLCLPSITLEAYAKRFDSNNPLPPAGAWLAERNPGQSQWTLNLVFTPGKAA
jgi:broad specificity phosphatase PhoE